MRYRDAGVDIERAEALKRDIRAAAQSTWSAGVRPLALGFAGVMELPAAPPGARWLAATMDGVGTKLHLALQAGRVGAAAADLVYHGANDLLVHGAQPVALLDYVAQDRLDAVVITAVVRGLADACREVGAVLLGGETAEMPDTYMPGVVDVAGCMLGTVDPQRLLDGSRCRAGDVVLGLGSNGLHTNGYSLARLVLAHSGLELSDPLPGGRGTLADALLAPHRWYGRALTPWLELPELHALAHVTGGGIAGNLGRVLPAGVRAEIDAEAWPRPPLMRWLIEAGQVPEEDARRSVNLGIGMIVVCDAGREQAVSTALRAAGETVYVIGALRAGERGVDWVD